MNAPDLILHNGKITTLDGDRPQVSAVVMAGGRITAIRGEELLANATDKTRRIDLKGRRVIPGLNDSHMHVIRGGLSYNLELRWDGVPSLADGLRMPKEQAQRKGESKNEVPSHLLFHCGAIQVAVGDYFVKRFII